MCLFLLLVYCSAAVSCFVFAAVVCHFFAIGFSKWYAIVLLMIVKRPPLKSCLLLFAASEILPRSLWCAKDLDSLLLLQFPLILSGTCCCVLSVAVISATTRQILWCGIICFCYGDGHSVMLVLSLLSRFRCICLFGVFFPPLVGDLFFCFLVSSG